MADMTSWRINNFFWHGMAVAVVSFKFVPYHISILFRRRLLTLNSQFMPDSFAGTHDVWRRFVARFIVGGL
jgi:hypothetical protein